MVRLYLVRHGKPLKRWEEHPDPGLDEEGAAQAQAGAEEIARRTKKPLAIWSSPMRRCRETAGFLGRLWGHHLSIVPAMTEIPSPVANNTQDRSLWLRKVLSMRWHEFLADPELIGGTDFPAWRRGVLGTLLRAKSDCVIFTHFVAINAALGSAYGDERIIMRLPNHCSIWTFESDGTRLSLSDAGEEISGARVPLEASRDVQ